MQRWCAPGPLYPGSETVVSASEENALFSPSPFFFCQTYLENLVLGIHVLGDGLDHQVCLAHAIKGGRDGQVALQAEKVDTWFTSPEMKGTGVDSIHLEKPKWQR